MFRVQLTLEFSQYEKQKKESGKRRKDEHNLAKKSKDKKVTYNPEPSSFECYSRILNSMILPG